MATVLEHDPTAVIGRRVVATLIDGTLVFVPSLVIASTEIKSFELQGLDGEQFCDQFIDRFERACVSVDDTAYYDDGDAAALGWAGIMGLAVLFFVLLQGLTGWTVGKLLLGLRTVREDGSRPGLLKALVRWVFWIVDFLPVLGMVAFITSLTTVGHRRVGDMVAKTFVVRSSAAGSPIGVGVVSGDPSIPQPPLVAHPAPVAKPGPQWDEARGTYIQWDPEQALWMRWDDTDKAWEPIDPPAVTIPEPPPPPDPPPTGPPVEAPTIYDDPQPDPPAPPT